MKNFRGIALCLALAGGGTAQTVTVSSSDLGGTDPISGTITFQPALSDGTLASAHLSGGGITSRFAKTATVTAGVFSIRVADTSTTNPVNLCYSVTVHTANGYQSLGPGFTCVQPAANNYWCTAGICNFDAYLPSVPGLAVISAGPAGKDGVQGIQGIQGVPGLQGPPGVATSANIYAANPTAYVAFGDSNTQSPDGYLSNPLNVYVNRIANVLAIASPVNYGTGGDQACDVGNRWMFPSYAPGIALPYPLVTLMIGTNDENFNPGPSAYQATALACYGADLTWATVPSSAKVLAGSGTVTGTCAADTTYAQAPGEKCTAAGSTLSLPFTTTQPGAVYVWVRYIDGDTGTWTYSLDGSPAVARTTALSPVIATHNGSTQAPGMIRLANVPSGTHTLVFTQTAAGTMAIIGVGYPPSTASTSTTPYAVVGTLINQANGANQTGVNAYRADEKSEIAQLKADGLLLFLAPMDTYVSMTTAAGDIAPTGGTLHMYDNGQGEAALAFLSALSMYPGNASSSGSLLTTANTWSQGQNFAAGTAGAPGVAVGNNGMGIGNPGGGLGLIVGNGWAARFSNSDWRWNGAAPMTFSSGDPTATFGDVGFSRVSPGVMALGNGGYKDATGIWQVYGHLGPATAPSGSCSTPGEWVFSQDGHGTVCVSGTWTSKL